ncbi:MAG: hypothetical protein V7727_11065 [Sneathiella sp.]
MYTPALAETICDRLANGESLRKVCLDDAMPDKATVLRWPARDPEFRRQYEFALEWRGDRILDEILEIADGINVDRLGRGGNNPPTARNQLAEAKLQIGVRKWLYCRLAPKKRASY